MNGWLLALMLLGSAPLQAKPPVQADRVLVEKQARRLTLYAGAQVLAQFPIALGFNPLGHKQIEGDGRTPEGHYRLTFKNSQSRYYKSIRVSYPNAQDRRHAASLGQPPGGDIMIHGQPPGWGWAAFLTQQRDWTLGCIALTNPAMEEVWQRVPVNTPIEIRR